jgi:hypothetical protein
MNPPANGGRRRLSRMPSLQVAGMLEIMEPVELVEKAMEFPVDKLIPIAYETESKEQSTSNTNINTSRSTAAGTGTGRDVLDVILQDCHAKKYFKLFLTKRNVESYLAFCEEVDEFKLLPGMEYLQHSAKKIYKKFMMPNAKLQVDMSTQMREEIFQKLANPSLDMFKKIITRVKNGILQDSLARFFKSPQYKEFKKITKKQLQSQMGSINGIGMSISGGIPLNSMNTTVGNNSSTSTSSSSHMTHHHVGNTSAMDGEELSGRTIHHGSLSSPSAGNVTMSLHTFEELKAIDTAAKNGTLDMSHLDFILNNQTVLYYFKLFVEQQHCSENLMLYEEVEHFRRLPSYQIVLRSAKKIYEKYLNPDGNSKRTLEGISPAHRERIAQKLENANRNTFDEVEKECYDTMRQVLVPDFLDSRMFMALVGAWTLVDENYPIDMLKGEFEMAFLRHRFNHVQEARGLNRSGSVTHLSLDQKSTTTNPTTTTATKRNSIVFK